VARVSQREIRETLWEVRRAAEQLCGNPARRDEAESHARALEHLMAGHASLRATPVVRSARAFLLEWDDHGFIHDHPPPGGS
jgi:hypothetical protein